MDAMSYAVENSVKDKVDGSKRPAATPASARRLHESRVTSLRLRPFLPETPFRVELPATHRKQTKGILSTRNSPWDGSRLTPGLSQLRFFGKRDGRNASHSIRRCDKMTRSLAQEIAAHL